MNRFLIIIAAVLLLSTGAAYAGSFLGVYPEELGEELAKKLGYTGRGVYVSSVVDDGPAEKAGMKDQSVIVKIDGDDIVGPGHLRDILGSHSPGDKVKVKVWKDGKTETFAVTLGKHKDLKDEMKQIVIRGEPKAWIGVGIQDLTEQLGEYFGVEKGVLVTEVFDDSPAKKADIKAGDVITKVDDEKVEWEFDLTNIISEKEPKSTVTVHIVRDRKELSKQLELAEIPEGYRKDERVFLWGSDEGAEFFPYLSDIGKLKALKALKEIEVPEVEMEVQKELEELKDLDKDLRKELEELKKGLEELKKQLEKSK